MTRQKRTKQENKNNYRNLREKKNKYQNRNIMALKQKTLSPQKPIICHISHCL
jgi:hypothetical protein